MIPMTLSRRATLIALGATVTLPGCVIAPYGTYYRPVASRGLASARRAYCGGKAGPNTGLRIDLGGALAIEVSSVLDPGSLTGLSIRLELDVPPRTELVIDGPIRLKSDDELVDVKLTDPVYGGRTSGPGDRWQAGEALSTGSSSGRMTLQTFIDRPGERLRIVWPVTRLNGQPFIWPELALERRRFDGGIEPFNC